MNGLEPSLTEIESRVENVLATPPLPWPGDPAPSEHAPVEIGRSRAGQSIRGYRIGHGPVRISVVAGCHADEPVGPRLMSRLVPYLRSLRPPDPLVSALEWWIIPHINPDGADVNAGWQHRNARHYSFSEYLPGRVRELPGDDVEFGFPRGPEDGGARPENAAAARWWESADGAFNVHMSLHGMAWAGGPWFLIEPAWVERTVGLREHCAARVTELGYRLHDVQRHGEKGFTRVAPGFSTRPNSVAMRDHFLALDDSETASRFHPSSMEFMRSLGGDPLTLVSEMPLFILPGVGEDLGPPDPTLESWRLRIAEWSARAANDPNEVEAEASSAGLVAMPVFDQMRLQWALISAAIATVVQSG